MILSHDGKASPELHEGRIDDGSLLLQKTALYDSGTFRTFASGKIDNPQRDSIVSSLDEAGSFLICRVAIRRSGFIFLLVVSVNSTQFKLTNAMGSTGTRVEIVGRRVSTYCSLLSKLHAMSHILD